MAYTHRTNRDIRTVSLSNTTSVSTAAADEPTPALHKTAFHNPKKELLAIVAYSAPLVIALAAASVYDAKHHWVVTLAERVLKLGS